jgi:CRP-like cAMP-binding protein
MVAEYSEIFISRFAGPIRARRLVTGLVESDKQRLNTIMRSRQYQMGDTIFARNVIPAEVLVLTKGSAELNQGGPPNETRVVAPGEVLGLTETLAEAKFCDTLTAITDCELNVISRDDLIWFLRQTPEACYRSLEVVAENLHAARERAVNDH